MRLLSLVFGSMQEDLKRTGFPTTDLLSRDYYLCLKKELPFVSHHDTAACFQSFPFSAHLPRILTQGMRPLSCRATQISRILDAENT